MFEWSKNKIPANRAKSGGLDLSQVGKERAQLLFELGKLEKIMLVPEMFGGEEIDSNTVFVPVGIAAIKSDIDEKVIAQLAKEGKVTQYEAKPRYDGDSFVPCRIQIRAHDPGEFITEIKIWGDSSIS